MNVEKVQSRYNYLMKKEAEFLYPLHSFDLHFLPVFPIYPWLLNSVFTHFTTLPKYAWV